MATISITRPTKDRRITTESPRLRLWEPGMASGGGGARGLAGKTLPQFVEDWFIPIVLIGERDSSPGTITLYRETASIWQRLTLQGNNVEPILTDIDSAKLAKFKEDFRSATWQRSPLHTAKKYPYSEYSIAKHLKNLRTIVKRLGRRLPGDCETARVLAHAPKIHVKKPRKTRPKAAFSLAMVRQIVAGAATMQRPLKSLVPPGQFWVAFDAAAFYTGLRRGTLLSLDESMWEEREDGPWLVIPASAVTKTRKAIEVPVHPQLVEALRPIRGSDPQGLLLPWSCCVETLNKYHAWQQEIAGVPQPKRMTPHAWRRTFGEQMGLIGAKQGIRVAQAALDHSDEETTREFYADLAGLIRQLPDILPAKPKDADQRFLF